MKIIVTVLFLFFTLIVLQKQIQQQEKSFHLKVEMKGFTQYFSVTRCQAKDVL